MNDGAAIGVFDSGLGGLSVLREMRKLLPREDFIYLADSAWCPYGGRSRVEVLERAEWATAVLVARGVKLVTVACNTATVSAIDELRRRQALPLVGMEPAVKPAAAATRTGVIGVLSTRSTADGERMHSLIQRYAHGVKVLTQACPGLVQRVENGDLDGPGVCELIERYTTPLLAAGADTLVLGCTHYPFLRPAIEDVVGVHVALIDTGAAVARRVVAVLGERGQLSTRTRAGKVQWLTTGDAATVAVAARRVWGSPVDAKFLTDGDSSNRPSGIRETL